MTYQYIHIAHRGCHIFAAEQPRLLLIQPVGKHEIKEMEQEAGLLHAGSPVPVLLLALETDDWERDMAPWTDPELRRHGTTDTHAQTTLKVITDHVLPHLHALYGTLPSILGGYSLGALFSLWAAYQTPCFSGIAAASPSVWLEGWEAFADSNRPQAMKIYLSLGDQEEKTRNKTYARIGNSIRATHQSIGRQAGPDATTLVWETGNHFTDTAGRTVRGFIWCIEQLITTITR